MERGSRTTIFIDIGAVLTLVLLELALVLPTLMHGALPSRPPVSSGDVLCGVLGLLLVETRFYPPSILLRHPPGPQHALQCPMWGITTSPGVPGVALCHL